MAATKRAPTDRIVELLDHIDRGGRVSVPWIVRQFGVSEGTAKRTLATLKTRRPTLVPCDATCESGAEKFWRLAERSVASKGPDQVVALELAYRTSTWLSGTPLLQVLSTIIEEARSETADHDQDRLNTFVSSFHHRTRGDASYAGKRNELDRLMYCIRERRPCEFEYERHDGTRTYRVHPLLLVLYRTQLYLVARKLPDKARRTFAIAAIRTLSFDPTEPSFPRPGPNDLDPSSIFRDSFGIFTDVGEPEDVELLVRGPAIELFSRCPVHPTQSIEATDGGVRVRLRVAVCPELRSFVRSLVPHVRVLAPAALRDHLDAAVRQYVSEQLDR